MATSDYADRVKILLTMIYDHELTKIPEPSDFNRQVRNWAAYLSEALIIPEDQLLVAYKTALDIRNENKVSAKFRIQDMQAAWSQIMSSENYKKQVPNNVCSICNNTGYVNVYNVQMMREVKTKCNH